MANTPRLRWPFPEEQEDPWYDSFLAMLLAEDASAYASREDRQLVLASGATFTFDSGSGVLSWDAPVEILSPISGFKITISTGSVTMLDGQLFYCVLTRSPVANVVASVVVANSVPNTDDAFIIGVRNGAAVYFRTGVRIQSGESVNIFNLIGGGSVTDVYERSVTFGVPEGTLTQEATIGRVTYAGSLVGVSLELTRPITAGTVTVNVKRNAAVVMTAVLDVSHTTSRQVTTAGGAVSVVTNDALTVEVVAAAYANADVLDAGLTVSVALLAGISMAPGGVPDASTSQKGITKLSVAPVAANNPIAVGDNDSRNTNDRTAGGIRSATTVVVASGATAPTAGQALVAISDTAAIWKSVGMGLSGQKIIELVWSSQRQSNDSATPLVVGGFSFNPNEYTLSGSTKTIIFRAVAHNGNSPLTTHVRLVNVTDSDTIATLDFVNVTALTKVEASLTVGAGGGQVDNSEKIYEVRIYVDAPVGMTDFIDLYSASLLVVNTTV